MNKEIRLILRKGKCGRDDLSEREEERGKEGGEETARSRMM